MGKNSDKTINDKSNTHPKIMMNKITPNSQTKSKSTQCFRDHGIIYNGYHYNLFAFLWTTNLFSSFSAIFDHPQAERGIRSTCHKLTFDFRVPRPRGPGRCVTLVARLT